MQGEENRVPKAEAGIIITGAGSGGSATTADLARRGVGILLLEKSHLLCEKVCEDRFTPCITRALVRLGTDISEKVRWSHNKELCVYGGRIEPFQLDWPKLADLPSYGLVRGRVDFDDLMVKHAVGCGVELAQGANVTEAILDDCTGRIIGMRTRDDDEYHAPPVVAVDGNSSHLSVSMGLDKRSDRSVGMVCHAYYRSPRSDDDYFES